ncbi:MAG: SDR family oxidoreductase [Acidobacteriaceae bacterium]|jgi:short-subunit dehydrogenase|nr:SDR family oxidoreductase [Acidobacteriaceae bacterium]
MSERVLVLGATSGIAEATCRVWAKQGASLVLVGRSAEKLAAVAADLRARGARLVETAVADLDDTARHPQLLADCINALGGLDVAYLAHGIMGEQQQSEEDFNAAAQVLYTNFLSPVSLCTWLSNYFVKQGRGVLAVISSVAGERGRKSNYVYGSSKAGLSAFLDGLRNRVDRQGVTVLTIKPGPVKTAMTMGMKGSEKFADPDKVAQSIVDAIHAKKDVLYVPGIWKIIMFVIRHIPESVFKKLNL